MRRAMLRCLLPTLAAAALAVGCGNGDEFTPLVCTDTGGRPVAVAGEWIIEGDGERETCGEADLNQGFHLGPAHFRVRETDPNPPPQQDAGLDARPDAGVPDGRTDGADAGDGGDAAVGGDAGAGDDADTGDASGGDDAGTGDAGAGDDAGTGDAGTGDAAVAGDAGASDGSAGDALATDAAAPADGPADAGPADGGADAAPDAAVTYSSATLSLESPIPGFTFEGTVTGSCVSFRTSEQLAEGGTITYSFTGEYQSSWPRGISGTFTGTGPGSCVSRGSFTVEVQ